MVAGLPFSARDGRGTFPGALARNQSMMVMVGERAENLPATPARKALPLQLRAIRRTRPNVLPIGYCTPDISGRRYEDIPAIRAGELVF